jgi:hypothetical protein
MHNYTEFLLGNKVRKAENVKKVIPPPRISLYLMVIINKFVYQYNISEAKLPLGLSAP